MSFRPMWTAETATHLSEPQSAAAASLKNRQKDRQAKAGKAEGLFKQVDKCVRMLLDNPRHPGLQTHVYGSIENPYDRKARVFEAYVQNRTAGAYGLFWCNEPRSMRKRFATWLTLRRLRFKNSAPPPMVRPIGLMCA